ncbi:unnamed protein product, partial [Polarella glacialis]
RNVIGTNRSFFSPQKQLVAGEELPRSKVAWRSLFLVSPVLKYMFVVVVAVYVCCCCCFCCSFLRVSKSTVCEVKTSFSARLFARETLCTQTHRMLEAYADIPVVVVACSCCCSCCCCSSSSFCCCCCCCCSC